jgi:hypothetical protein
MTTLEATQSNACTCDVRTGSQCNCGCQDTKKDRRAGCRCGDTCRCGFKCACSR